jgi:hypothetical protein
MTIKVLTDQFDRQAEFILQSKILKIFNMKLQALSDEFGFLRKHLEQISDFKPLGNVPL